MITKVYAYAIAALLAVLCIGGAWWYVSHLRTEVADARAKEVAAEQQVSSCAGALNVANANADAAIAQAKAEHDQAQAAIDFATTQKGKNAATAAAFAKKLNDSAKSPDCRSVLEATLCPALTGY